MSAQPHIDLVNAPALGDIDQQAELLVIGGGEAYPIQGEESQCGDQGGALITVLERVVLDQSL